MFWVLPSLKVPVAENCCVWPIDSVGLKGVTWMAVRVGPVVVEPEFTVKAASAIAQGKLLFISVIVSTPTTEVPGRAAVWYSLIPVGVDCRPIKPDPVLS